MSRLLHFRVGASIQAMAFVLFVSSAGMAQGQDGVGLGTGSASCQLADTSTITLVTAAFPIPPLPATGALNVSVDSAGAARCEIVEFDPIQISGVGFVCITPPADSCPAGIVSCPSAGGGAGVASCVGDCNGDSVVDVSELVVGTNIGLGLEDTAACPSLDAGGSGVAINDIVDAVGNAIDGCPGGPTGIGIDLVSDRVIGECTSNEDCYGQCDTYCADIGKVPTDSGFGCEGFCDGGEFDGQACTLDTDCVGGSCNGADGVLFGNICECQCIDIAVGEPPAEGNLSCQLGSSIVVERGAPCGDGDVLITVGTRCIPLTTTEAATVLLSANGLICTAGGNVCSTDDDCAPGDTCGMAMIGPQTTTGTPGVCSAIATGSFSGVGLRGYVNFFGSTIGDLVTKVSSDCL